VFLSPVSKTKHRTGKFSLVVLMLGMLAANASCRLPLSSPASTPRPQPTELAGTSFPEDSQPGGLEATFISSAWVAGAQNERCHKLLRFLPDGRVLYSNFVCFPPTNDTAARVEEIAQWFIPENNDVTRGDYARLDGRVWLRIVEYDHIHETTYLRAFQGVQCSRKMVLQEPAVQTYSGIPSNLTEPVLEYVRLAGAAYQDENETAACRAAGFRFLWRSYITLADGEAEYRIQTDPGEACALHYTAPDGAQQNTLITAGGDGVCSLRWPVGSQRGEGRVTVTIDEIVQDFALKVN
jgi:hypothetical protein